MIKLNWKPAHPNQIELFLFDKLFSKS